jgi:SAM-dependent methyltransferase
MSKNFHLNDVKGALESSQSLTNFIIEDLRSSLSSIGFSNVMLSDLLLDIGTLDVNTFGEKWKEELLQKYSIGFFQKIVPGYFSKYVVPVTPSSDKIIDVGCGTGILAKVYVQDARFKKVLGIDINQYPEWEIFQSEKITFKVIKEDDFLDFLKAEQPDSIVLTWTLHHMEPDEQERYLEYIYDKLKPGATVVVLEDSYSDTLAPERGADKYERFMKWNVEDRQKIMSVYDWVANRVLAQRENVPIPCAYRTLEGWRCLLEKKGFKIITQKFIGFPDSRDINTPQSLLVARKA